MNHDSPFMGKSIAVTGKLENYTRDGIKARLLKLEAKPVSKVSKRTDYLILGVRPGNKLVKALALGITVLSEQEFEQLVGVAGWIAPLLLYRRSARYEEHI